MQYSLNVEQNYPFMFFLKNAGIVAYIKSFSIVFLYIISLRFIPEDNRKKLLKILVFSFLAWILPLIPLFFSVGAYERYQPYNVISYFSYLGSFVFIASLIYLIGVLINKKRYLYGIYCGLVSVILFFITLFTQYSNEKITEDLNLSQDRFEIIKTFKESADIKTGDNVFVANLYYTKNISGGSTMLKQAHKYGALINHYYDIKAKYYGVYDKFYEKFHDTDETLKIFFFAQAAKTHDTYIAMVECKGYELTPDIKDICCNNIKLGYMSSYKKFSISCASKGNTMIRFNGKNSTPFGNMHVSNINYFSQKAMVEVDILGKNIYPASLSISNITHPYANNIRVGAYNPKFQERFANHYKRIILNDKKWVQQIEEKAEKRNKTFEEALDGDANWLIYN